QYGATEGVVERQALAQPERHGEHPLTQGRPRQHGVDEVRRLFGHPPSAATRTDRPGLAREGDEAFEPTPDPAKPRSSWPQPMKSRNSRAMKRGRPAPSVAAAVAARKRSR